MSPAPRGKPDPLRVVGYLRVSTSAQQTEGLGLQGQRAAVERHAHERGWELVGVYQDVVSGAAADEDDLSLPRPGFRRLLAEANGGRGVRYVVVYATDRLWRSDFARVLVQRDLKKAGLDVRSITEPRYSLSKAEPSDVLIHTMLEGVAVYERGVIEVRMRRGRITKAQQGGYAGGQAPYGYSSARGSKVLAIDADEAKTVKRVFSFRRRGLSNRAIAKRLNTEGVPTRRGKQWTHVQVLLMLRRRKFYEGKVSEYAGVKAKGQQPAIL